MNWLRMAYSVVTNFGIPSELLNGGGLIKGNCVPFRKCYYRLLVFGHP